MSAKNLDEQGRWRNKNVTFRVSPEEDAQIEIAVRLSGLTKQDYITRRLLCQDVVVQGNPRVYKALRNQLAAVLEQLERIEAGCSLDLDLLSTINLLASIMDGMKEDPAYGK
jgi:electron transfer flavoprotein alpha/beta subunit